MGLHDILPVSVPHVSMMTSILTFGFAGGSASMEDLKGKLQKRLEVNAVHQ